MNARICRQFSKYETKNVMLRLSERFDNTYASQAVYITNRAALAAKPHTCQHDTNVRVYKRQN